MEMHCLPERDVLRVLDENDCDLLEAAPYDYIDDIGLSYRFLARKRVVRVKGSSKLPKS